MARNQAATQSKMEDLLASIRQAIDPEEPNDPQEAEPAKAETESDSPLPPSWDAARAALPASRSEEISNLRKRIAGNLGRDSQASGFATILGGRPAEPALLEDRSIERLPPRLGPQTPLRQSVSDSPAADFAEPAAVPAPKPEPTYWRSEFRAASPAARPVTYHERVAPGGQGLISDEAGAAANAAFNRLAESLVTRATGDRSIEDLTRELLRTMLKQWLDDNLPELVERIVRDEIERVARRGPRR